MVRKWKLGATGTALLASAFVVVACSSKSDDDSNNGGKGGSGGSSGSGVAASAGKGGTGTGGTGGSTGGTGGSTGGTGGSTGGTAGMSTTGGSAGMGAAGAPMTFACPSPVAASCNYITTWGTFSNGMFGGGLYVYGDLKQDTTDTGEFHVTGTVTTYSGLGIYFNSCTDVSAYSNVTFTISGTSGNMMASSLWYIIQQNSDEPADAMGMKGQCGGMPGVPCQSPYTPFTISNTPQTVAFSALAGGATMAPGMTDGKFDPKQAIGMQWQFRPETAQTAGYMVDVKLDNVTFGTGTVMGTGGMGAGGASTGGMGAGGASSGGASSGGASSGGASTAGASSGGKAGSGAAGASADMASGMIECTAMSMGGMGAGGASSGGASSGGASSGGASSGGASMGGASSGGAPMGGAGGRAAGGGAGRGTAGVGGH